MKTLKNSIALLFVLLLIAPTTAKEINISPLISKEKIQLCLSRPNEEIPLDTFYNLHSTEFFPVPKARWIKKVRIGKYISAKDSVSITIKNAHTGKENLDFRPFAFFILLLLSFIFSNSLEKASSFRSWILRDVGKWVCLVVSINLLCHWLFSIIK